MFIYRARNLARVIVLISANHEDSKHRSNVSPNYYQLDIPCILVYPGTYYLEVISDVAIRMGPLY